MEEAAAGLCQLRRRRCRPGRSAAADRWLLLQGRNPLGSLRQWPQRAALRRPGRCLPDLDLHLPPDLHRLPRRAEDRGARRPWHRPQPAAAGADRAVDLHRRLDHPAFGRRAATKRRPCRWRGQAQPGAAVGADRGERHRHRRPALPRSTPRRLRRGAERAGSPAECPVVRRLGLSIGCTTSCSYSPTCCSAVCCNAIRSTVASVSSRWQHGAPTPCWPPARPARCAGTRPPSQVARYWYSPSFYF